MFSCKDSFLLEYQPDGFAEIAAKKWREKSQSVRGRKFDADGKIRSDEERKAIGIKSKAEVDELNSTAFFVPVETNTEMKRIAKSRRDYEAPSTPPLPPTPKLSSSPLLYVSDIPTSLSMEEAVTSFSLKPDAFSDPAFKGDKDMLVDPVPMGSPLPVYSVANPEAEDAPLIREGDHSPPPSPPLPPPPVPGSLSPPSPPRNLPTSPPQLLPTILPNLGNRVSKFITTSKIPPKTPTRDPKYGRNQTLNLKFDQNHNSTFYTSDVTGVQNDKYFNEVDSFGYVDPQQKTVGNGFGFAHTGKGISRSDSFLTSLEYDGQPNIQDEILRREYMSKLLEDPMKFQPRSSSFRTRAQVHNTPTFERSGFRNSMKMLESTPMPTVLEGSTYM